MQSTDTMLGQKLMLAFKGVTPSPEILDTLRRQQIGGVTLFLPFNVQNPAQIRALTTDLQSAARDSGQPLLLIAADQETGQLAALGEGFTAFSGNMALGAAGDVTLVERVGEAIGREMAAVGVNVNYAPVCGVNSNPQNPDIGIRSFGDDPHQVAQMATAMIRGLQRAGVAATAKHFPGLGDTDVDSHYEVPVVAHNRERLERVEMPPFQAAVAEGAKLMMTGHVGVPALSGHPRLPATLSRAVMHDLLREEFGFAGVLISDAMEMGAISQGDHLVLDSVAAVRAGVDLLLLNSDVAVQQRLYRGLAHALDRDIISRTEFQASLARILALKIWLAEQPQPGLEVVASAGHRALARELAERALTLVRNADNLLPLKLPSSTRVAVIVPQPLDLTPADSSSYLKHTLAAALRAHHPNVTEFIVSPRPDAGEIANIRTTVGDYDLLIIGTLCANLQPEQGELVNALLTTAVPAVTVALRTPYDLPLYPAVRTHVCTYSMQVPAMYALAAALWGKMPFPGRLPVTIPGIEL